MTAHVVIGNTRALYSQDGTLLAFIPRPQPIPPRQYRLYADLILSGDLPQRDVPQLLEDEPEFAAWYREHRMLPAHTATGRAA